MAFCPCGAKGIDMEDKLSLTYKDNKLKITLGDKELPLDVIVDPCYIIISADKVPSLRFEMVIDKMYIDDIEAFGKFVTKEELAEEASNESS